MIPGTYNFRVDAGSVCGFALTPQLNGANYDMTGWEAALTVFDANGANGFSIKGGLGSGSGISTTNAGVITVFLSAVQTAAIAALQAPLRHQVDLLDATGAEQRLLVGELAAAPGQGVLP